MKRTFLVTTDKGRVVSPGLPLGLAELGEPAPGAPYGARSTWWARSGTHDEWVQLGRVAIGLGYRVHVLGTPWRTEISKDGTRKHVEAPEVIGLTLTRFNGRERATLLRTSVLGDITTDEAVSWGVSSAGQLGALLARGELGQQPVSRAVQLSAVLCSWAGPMMVYRASTGATKGRKWDQRRAYLGSWQQPMPQRGAQWFFRDAPVWDAVPVLRGVRTGFMVARVVQKGPFPCWPAAVAGDRLRVPLRGSSVVAIPMYVAAMLEAAGALHVERVLHDCWAPADPDMGHRIAAHYDGLGKSVYQRTHAALTPCPRWSGKLHMDGRIDWSLQQPDPRTARPDVACLLRSWVAAKTAAFLWTLPENAALAAHIDAVYECSGRTEAEQADELPVELWSAAPAEDALPGQWVSGLQPERGRFFAPGRWFFGPESPCMGGSTAGGPDPAFLRVREWTGDPRTDEAATSTAILAHKGGWYDYAWPGRNVEGEHGA